MSWSSAKVRHATVRLLELTCCCVCSADQPLMRTFLCNIERESGGCHWAVVSTGHRLFVDRPGVQFELDADAGAFGEFLRAAGYTGEIACVLEILTVQRNLRVSKHPRVPPLTLLLLLAAHEQPVARRGQQKAKAAASRGCDRPQCAGRADERGGRHQGACPFQRQVV